MGEFASLTNDREFEEYCHQFSSDDDSIYDFISSGVNLSSLPYIEIKKRTDKAILIKLDISISPFNNDKSYPIGDIWLPLAHVNINEKKKLIRIAFWLLRRKVEEQCSLIAEKNYNAECDATEIDIY